VTDELHGPSIWPKGPALGVLGSWRLGLPSSWPLHDQAIGNNSLAHKLEAKECMTTAYVLRMDDHTGGVHILTQAASHCPGSEYSIEYGEPWSPCRIIDKLTTCFTNLEYCMEIQSPASSPCSHQVRLPLLAPQTSHLLGFYSSKLTIDLQGSSRGKMSTLTIKSGSLPSIIMFYPSSASCRCYLYKVHSGSIHFRTAGTSCYTF